MLVPNRHGSTPAYRYGFNTQEKVDELKGVGNHFTAPYWEYDPRIGRRWNLDPIKISWESGYAVNRNNPILFNDPNGDCPDCEKGKYTIKKGDNLWSLEKKWNMKQGSLAKLNKGLDPKKLMPGQIIRTTLKASDLPVNVKLNSNESLNGMDNFFNTSKGHDQRGVNRIVEYNKEEYDKLVTKLADLNKDWGMSDASTGGNLDIKKFFLNDTKGYSNKTSDWFKNNNSVNEPATRTLYIYKGYAYNLNEFGNLLFGSTISKIGSTSLNELLFGGHVYSIFTNGKMDADNEVDAVKRGFGYYPGKKELRHYKLNKREEELMREDNINEGF